MNGAQLYTVCGYCAQTVLRPCITHDDVLNCQRKAPAVDSAAIAQSQGQGVPNVYSGLAPAANVSETRDVRDLKIWLLEAEVHAMRELLLADKVLNRQRLDERIRLQLEKQARGG